MTPPLDGVTRARGIAQAPGCLPLPYLIIEPKATPGNVAALTRALRSWEDTRALYQMKRFRPVVTADVLARVSFALEVAGAVLSNLRYGVCCQMVAQTVDGVLLGAIQYSVMPDRGTINLLAVDPRNVPSSPHPKKLRGVGTALVATAIRQMVGARAPVIYLHPWDKDAEAFWRSRGFAPCGGGGLLCVRAGYGDLERLVGACQQPEGERDVLLCGMPRAVRERIAEKTSAR